MGMKSKRNNKMIVRGRGMGKGKYDWVSVGLGFHYRYRYRLNWLSFNTVARRYVLISIYAVAYFR